MNKLFIALGFVSLALFSCTDDKDTLRQNGIIVKDVKVSYVTADDCTTSSGAVATELLFEIYFDNTKNESLSQINIDVVHPSNNGYFDYEFKNFQIISATQVNVLYCRSFIYDSIDFRVFIETPDKKLSSFKWISVPKPQ